MSERVKSRKIIIYDFDADGNERDTETSFEPVVQEASPEFVGVIQTMSLPHGEVPLSLGTWSVYKIYEKVVIWMLRPTMKEASL